jgi:lipopolysaccharide cholinephosphotransferase
METTKNLLTNASSFEVSDCELAKLKRCVLSILLDFVSVCDKYGINYFLAFGTLLGAVRHNGFSPWDDDIDVIVPVEEMDFAVSCMKKEYGSKYSYSGLCYGQWADPFSGLKIMRTGTVALEADTEGFPVVRGIDIDVFPLCHASKTRFGRWVQWKKWFFLNHAAPLCAQFHYPPKSLLNNDNKKVKKTFKIRRFFGFLLSFCSLSRWVKAVRRFDWREKKFSPYYHSEGRGIFSKVPFKTDIHQKAKLSFEGHEMYTFANYIEFLRICYGSDYMTPPPSCKRERHSFIRLDFGPFNTEL